ncbi:MAG: hypothetical protein ACRCT6_13105 [Notoacmeibacter sp.]
MNLNRLTIIASLMAKRYGARAATYANGMSFDVLTERMDRPRQKGGIAWLNFKTEDAYCNPRTVALAIRKNMKALWK